MKTCDGLGLRMEAPHASSRGLEVGYGERCLYIYRLHRAVIFAIVQPSRSSYIGFRAWLIRRNVRVTVYFFMIFVVKTNL